MKLREYSVREENKNNDFIQQLVSFTSSWRHFGEYHINNIMLFCVSSTLSGYAVYAFSWT